MSRYRDAVCKLCRREKKKLFLKGSRCITAKCSLDKKNYPPGFHGKRRTRETEYSVQLREKQSVKRSVFMTEKQFLIFFKKAEKEEGATGQNLLIKLECRLDNVVRRLGFASSIPQARQFVGHRHFKVNGKICNIPSYIVRKNDKITVKEKSSDFESIKNSLEKNSQTPPDWLKFNFSKMEGIMKRQPTREEVTLAGGDIKENLIVELYSK